MTLVNVCFPNFDILPLRPCTYHHFIYKQFSTRGIIQVQWTEEWAYVVLSRYSLEVTSDIMLTKQWVGLGLLDFVNVSFKLTLIFDSNYLELLTRNTSMQAAFWDQTTQVWYLCETSGHFHAFYPCPLWLLPNLTPQLHSWGQVTHSW